MQPQLINKVTLSYFLTYPITKESLFRKNQNEFVAKCANYANGVVIEIGSEDKYGYDAFFKDIKFIKTNPFREYFEQLDVTSINYPDNSADNYLCISVLEHVFDIRKAASELTRTLKPGGYLFITVPFAYPVHDTVDYWRFLPDSYKDLFSSFDILELYHLGGKFSSCAEVFQRPRGKFTIKLFPARMAGWLCILFSFLFERLDRFPQGYGLILRKR